jgi:hypothetical protein
MATAWVAVGVVALIAFGLCLWRLMPGLGYWDTAEFQMVLPVMGTAHPTGYPTYVLVGWLASLLLTPIGEPALRINVLSAVLVAIGVGFTVDLTRRLTASVVVAVVTGLALAMTPIVWAIGTHADPHALHFALLAIVVWLLVRWEGARRGLPIGQTGGVHDRHRADRWLIAAAVVTGVATGNHSLTLLLGPPIALYVVAVAPGIVRQPRLIAVCLLAAAIPAVLVRFELILRAGWFRAPFAYANPSTWDGFWYVTSGQQFHDWLTDPLSDWPRRIADLSRIAGQELGPLAPLAVVAFVVTAVRLPRYALLSGSVAAITCFFNSVYPDGAIDRYYIGPAMFAWTWLAILAATFVDAMAGDVRSAFEDALGPSDRHAAGGALARRSIEGLRAVGLVVAAAILLGPSLLSFSARATSVDRSQDRSAQIWTNEVLATLAPNAVVVSWWSYSTPLWYVTIVDGRRPDITIIDDRNRVDLNLLDLNQVIDLYIATRPVYVIRNDPAELDQIAERYTLRPLAAPDAPNVFRVTPNATAAVPSAGAWR